MALDRPRRRGLAEDAARYATWHTVDQQSQRWLKAGVLDAIVQALCPTEYAKLSRHGCHL